jgi:L-amino acid N-acyltransferase YncA
MLEPYTELVTTNPKLEATYLELLDSGFSKASDIQPSGKAEAYKQFLNQNLSHVDMRLDSPDESWVQIDDDNKVVGHFSIWYCETPMVDGKTSGFVGHYYARNAVVGKKLLHLACKLLGCHGCKIAVGPVDGNTWRRYRLVCGTTGIPRFVMEPQNPMDYPTHFLDAGFTTLATYSSSILDTKSDFVQSLETSVDQPKSFTRQSKTLENTSIRPINLDNFERELIDIYGIACDAFAENFLYSEISEFEFLARYKPLMPLVVPDLILIAEHERQPVGFVMAVPDPANSNCVVKTAVVKTIGRIQDDRFRGLGKLLMSECHMRAERLGFTSLIHALYKDDNTSSAYSTIHDAQVFRRYAVYGKNLKS